MKKVDNPPSLEELQNQIKRIRRTVCLLSCTALLQGMILLSMGIKINELQKFIRTVSNILQEHFNLLNSIIG